MKKTRNVFVVDFETNNSQEAFEEKKTHVWLWDICSIKDYRHYGGYNLDQMFDFLNTAKEDLVIYSHNLKFDGSFILSYILRQGWHWVNAKNSNLNYKEFSTIIDARKVYYRISIRLDNHVVEFRDSTKKIPGTVKSIALGWKLPILKGEIDYRMNRPLGYIPTQEEIAYIRNDTEIIARVLHELYGEGMTSLTASADSFKAFKKDIGQFNYDLLFPIVSLSVDDNIRKSYFGGVCFVNKKYKEQELHGVRCYDVNSMYPSVMFNEMLPYGNPVYDEGKPVVNAIYPLFIAHIKVQMRVKEGRFPCIMKRGFGLQVKNEYIEDTENTILDMWLTNVDLEQLLENYDVYHLSYIEYYSFHGSRNMFKSYIGKLYKIKCETTGAPKLLAKLKLNSLYGKFATNPYRHSVAPFIDEDGSLSMVIVNSEEVDPIYTALSCFVTAYARRKLFRAIEQNHDNFVYCDTDSIHVIGNAEGIEVDGSKLGAWDLEKEYVLFKALAQKTYYGVKTNGDKIIKACGAPDSVKQNITYEEFKMGNSFEGKLRPVMVEGGVILVDTLFTFKERN